MANPRGRSRRPRSISREKETPLSHGRGNKKQGNHRTAHPEFGELQIIGGTFRGSKLQYEVFRMKEDPVTRPMKGRVREAIFNLIGMEVKGLYAIDLFAGTGALGLEAISRGALGATFIERHVPTARIVAANILSLDVQAITTLKTTSAFLWAKRDLLALDYGKQIAHWNRPTGEPTPWLVFCSPPYQFYLDRQDDLLELISTLAHQAPAGSLLVVEADERFDFQLLPGGPVGEKRTDPWQVRTYPPAVVGIWRKQPTTG